MVIHEIDNLTKDAQAALRRTMETYMPYCRIIANAESLSKVIQPVRSRCLQVRVAAPTPVMIQNVLQHISKGEYFDLPQQLAQSISHFSRRNMRRAIMMLQSTKLRVDKLQPNTYVSQPEYEKFTQEIASEVLKEQSPKHLRMIRSKVYELLTKGITSDMIFTILMRQFLKTLPEPIKPEVLKYAVIFENRCKSGSKAIMHIEAFLARVMALYKGFKMKAR